MFISSAMLRAVYAWALQSIICNVVSKDVMAMLPSNTLINFGSFQRGEVLILASWT